MKLKDIEGLMEVIEEILETLADRCYREGKGELDTTIAKEMAIAYPGIAEKEIEIDVEKVKELLKSQRLYKSVDKHAEYMGEMCAMSVDGLAQAIAKADIIRVRGNLF